MRLGLFGARSDHRGLAEQTQTLARWLKPELVFGVDMGRLSPYPCDWSGYDPATLTVACLADLDDTQVGGWLDGLDVVVAAETFYAPFVVPLARRLGVATALHYNPEFTSHLDDFGRPDLMLAPTVWRLDETPDAVVLPLGADRLRFPHRPRDKCGTLLHVVGHPAAHDRAGTQIVWEAMRFVRQPVRLVVRTQHPISARYRYSNVDVEIVAGDVADNRGLYADGDLLLHPRRYGGLSLPMIEAMSTGMPVLMPDAEPQRSMLPRSMLTECHTSRHFRNSSGPIWLHDTDPVALARRVDELVADPAGYRQMCSQADQWAQAYSWERLLPRWTATLEHLAERGPTCTQTETAP